LALKDNNFEVIIDGYGLFPYSEFNLTFIPQLFYNETIMLPIGIQSTQLHLNYWKEDNFNNFKKFLISKETNIKTYKEILNKVSNNLMQ